MQNRQQKRFGQGGSARFSGLLEEWGLVYRNQTETDKNTLFMGRSLHNPFMNIGLTDKRHMLTIAGSRGGKGKAAIVPNLLQWEGSALVIDPKGTNAAITARRRKEMGQEVFIVDPFNVFKDKDKKGLMDQNQTTHCFNPLKMLVDTGSDPKGRNDIPEQINAITEALVVSTSKDTHWDDGAKTVIAGLIGHLITHPDYKENPSLTQIRDLLAKTGDQKEWKFLVAYLCANSEAGGLSKDAGDRLMRGMTQGGGINPEILSILSNADKQTEWLSSPAMKKVLATPENGQDFKFSELKQKPTTIYLILPPEHLETHKRFLRLFINLTISQMSIGGKSEHPVLLNVSFG